MCLLNILSYSYTHIRKPQGKLLNLQQNFNEETNWKFIYSRNVLILDYNLIFVIFFVILWLFMCKVHSSINLYKTLLTYSNFYCWYSKYTIWKILNLKQIKLIKASFILKVRCFNTSEIKIKNQVNHSGKIFLSNINKMNKIKNIKKQCKLSYF